MNSRRNHVRKEQRQNVYWTYNHNQNSSNGESYTRKLKNENTPKEWSYIRKKPESKINITLNGESYIIKSTKC